jgi:anaerobic dimethyl sulfoxide reductase subunit A
MSQEASISPGETNTVYTTCQCNCGGNQHCVIKAHVRDGKIVAVEPDDRYNKNVGREDFVLSEQDLLKDRLQRRPCTMGMAFHKYIYHPQRILYPIKRSPGTERGEGKYTRISWEEALTTVADKMKETRAKYGPYSIIIPYMSNGVAQYLLSRWGAGVGGWGASSCDAAWLMSHIMLGATDIGEYAASSAADMLSNAKVIVLWGFDPTVVHHGPAHQFAWFIQLAREKGTPVIIIDPRYTSAAGTLADQWIPIKPGTDHAMFMAMAYVLFQAGLWDREFVARYVEPEGWAKWSAYISGQEDGMPKTPEWAEVRCAVPAETIRELALLGALER